MKIRVLHCIETIASGGVEQVRLTLVKGLDQNEYEHKIICTWEGGAIAEALNKEGVEIIPIGGFRHPFELGKYNKVLEIIKSYKPHIIHGAIFEGMLMAAVGGTIGKVPVVLLEETSDPTTRTQKAIFLQKLLATRADKVIGISPRVCDYLLERAKIPSHKVHLINNGVVFSESNLKNQELDVLKKELEISKDDIVIGAVGRVFDQVKRFSDILYAIKSLEKKEYKFLLVGDGPDLDNLKNLAVELEISDQFISVGYQSDTSPYYSMMDMLCVPSAHEGFGLVAVEAMFHKLPVIASAVGGLNDVVIHNETGFLVSPNNPNELAEKIKILTNSSELRRELGESGYLRAQENYSAERYCKEVQQLYTTLLEQKGVILNESV